ncbi:MAG TPA: N-6 DNA methylase [Candidatus Kapabacteria bacterium]|nr:N-6 DNA methylase [Candidatus Kapabacteria bacterium]
MLSTLYETKKHTKQKSSGSHYTPSGLADFLASRLVSYLPKDGSFQILDPACGDGELLSAFATSLNYSSRVTSNFVGIDQDVAATEQTLDRWEGNNLQVWCSDFLSLPVGSQEGDLFANERSTLKPADVIIANPPYVRTQVMGAAKSQQLAISFELTGRVDLYQAFLVAMTRALKSGGIMGVITSNRFLTTRGAASIRSFLATHYDILEIIDLGDTKLFEAAVLPAIFIGRKRDKGDSHSHPTTSFLRIYEDRTGLNGAEARASIFDILECKEDGRYDVEGKIFSLVRGTVTFGDPGEPWKLASPGEHVYLGKMESRSSFTLANLMHIRVGIKTTADKVFIRDDWSSVPVNSLPESILLKPIIDSSDCTRWTIDVSNLARKILYPYTVEELKRLVIRLDDYPKTRSYFEHFRKRLEGRTYLQESSREWFEIWVPHHPNAWQQPMLVAPDISPAPKFAYTDQGALVNGNCYWLTLRAGVPKDYLFLILGIVNSEAMTQYHDLAFNNKLYAGRRRYLTQYMEKYPIPSLDSNEAQEIIALVKQRVFGSSLSGADAIENKIESAVESLYGLS